MSLFGELEEHIRKARSSEEINQELNALMSAMAGGWTPFSVRYGYRNADDPRFTSSDVDTVIAQLERQMRERK